MGISEEVEQSSFVYDLQRLADSASLPTDIRSANLFGDGVRQFAVCNDKRNEISNWGCACKFDREFNEIYNFTVDGAPLC